MPRFRGTAALEIAKRRGLDVPFLFVSGTIGEDIPVAAMKHEEWCLRLPDEGSLRRLVPAIERELRDVQVRRERAHEPAQAGKICR